MTTFLIEKTDTLNFFCQCSHPTKITLHFSKNATTHSKKGNTIFFQLIFTEIIQYYLEV